MGERVRVLVADDSAFVRRAVERILSGAPEIEVVGAAESGEEAIELAKSLRPDVIILDVSMPGVDGLEALKRIMQEAPTAVLMLSTQTQQGAGVTINALELGAVDFVDKTKAGTVMDIYSLGPLLREKVLTVAGASVRAVEPEEPAPEPVRRPPRPAPPEGPYELVVIGASTGGPRALAEVVSHLPGGFGAGIVIAQHMPPGFTQTLADRLNRRSDLEVVEARGGELIEPGRVLVVPGGKHATVARTESGLALVVASQPTDLIHRPSIDLLLSSAAETVGDRAIGVVLTGMGDDGARGLRKLQEVGGRTVAESEQTAVIFGMPRAAARAAERVLPITAIGPHLLTLCGADRAAQER